MGPSRYFITTPIFYVNSGPHLGHHHTVVLADALHRLHRLLNPKQETIFSTGTDEHGLKIQQAASRAKQDELTFCNRVSKQFKDLFDNTGITYTDYIRTTEDRHRKCVEHFWKALQDKGWIYTGMYKGWYSTQDELFLSESEVTEVKQADGTSQKVSVESGHPVEWMEEKNYLFCLSHFQEDLVHWLKSSEGVVKPAKFQKLLMHWIEAGLQDLSLSRQSTRVHWGIRVPEDSSQTIYVWLDALVNYLTVSGYPDKNHAWPPDCHVIGKDILKFHGIYWPAFLMAAGLEPPRSILCHSHWTVNDEKMSKSKGNIVCPYKKVDKYTADGIRYFLLKEGVPHSDGNFNNTKVQRLLNAELADTLGNLLSRCTAPLVNKHQMFPSYDAEAFESYADGQKILDQLRDLGDKVKDKYLEGNIYQGIDEVMTVLRQTNALVQDAKPWELAKSESAETRLNAVLHVALEVLRVSGIVLQPVIPVLATRILDKLQVPTGERSWADAQSPSLNPRPLTTDRTHVFSRLKVQSAAA